LGFSATSDFSHFLKDQNATCSELNPWLAKVDTNKSPMIGILTQTLSDKQQEKLGYKSYIVAAYVKYIEAAGGRVVPMIWDQSEEVTRE
jgi:hypothetical protein